MNDFGNLKMMIISQEYLGIKFNNKNSYGFIQIRFKNNDYNT